MRKYSFTVYAVTTVGGQICHPQDPQEIEIFCKGYKEMEAAITRLNLGVVRDSYANYYLTDEAARRAIDWALSN